MDSWKRKHKNIEKEKKCRGEVYSFIADQIEGLIDIEIGNYLYEKAKSKFSLHYNRWANGGIDIYIFDEDFCKINDFDKMEFTVEPFGIDDLLMIEHLHYEDILWFLMNFDKEKVKIKQKVDEYIRWKEKYNEKNKK